MNRIHRWLLPVSALALTACSGASEQLVEIAPSSDAGSPQSSSPSPGSSNGSTAGGNTGDTGNTADASTGGNGNGFDPGPAPAQCPSGGTEQASGSGDSASDATPFDIVACGTLAAGQSYFWTFTLPPSTSQFGLSFTGGTQIELTVDGTTVDVVPGATLPFHRKDPYTLKVTPMGSSSVSYVIVVDEQ